MTRSRFLADLAAQHAADLTVDALIVRIRRALGTHQISQATAVVTLRSAGCCEPEIWEIIT